jgi:hypothetical protein
VPILVTVYDLVRQGQLALDDPLTVLKIDQVDRATACCTSCTRG